MKTKTIWFLVEEATNKPVVLSLSGVFKNMSDEDPDNRVLVGPYIFSSERAAQEAAHSDWWPSDIAESIMTRPGSLEPFLKGISQGFAGSPAVPDVISIDTTSNPFDPYGGLTALSARGALWLWTRNQDPFWGVLATTPGGVLSLRQYAENKLRLATGLFSVD